MHATVNKYKRGKGTFLHPEQRTSGRYFNHPPFARVYQINENQHGDNMVIQMIYKIMMQIHCFQNCIELTTSSTLKLTVHNTENSLI